MSEERFRIDFRFVNISEDVNAPEYVSVPDPDRYEYVNDSRGEGYVDKLDPRRFFFPIEVIADAISRTAGMQFQNLGPEIDDSLVYIRSRGEAIRRGIQEGQFDLTTRDITDEEMQQFVSDELDFVIVSIDLVGSTKLSQSVEPRAFANITATYSSEVAKLCQLLHGRPLKFMGDGVLLYFPAGSFIRRHDLAVDFALSIRDLIYLGLNPALTEFGLPAVACRIGADSGKAYVMTIGDSRTTNHVDIIGEVICIATKIEKAAPPGGIYVGESIMINTHTMWMQHMRPVTLPEGWPYKQHGSAEAYPIYALDVPLAEPE